MLTSAAFTNVFGPASSKTMASSRTRWASSSTIWAGVTSLKRQDLVLCWTTKELVGALREDGLRS